MCSKSNNTGGAACATCGNTPAELHKAGPPLRRRLYCPACCPACRAAVEIGAGTPVVTPPLDPWYYDTAEDKAVRSVGGGRIRLRNWLGHVRNWF